MTYRPNIKRICIAATALLVLAAGAIAQEAKPNTLTAAEKAAGWQLLFDGATTKHFRGYKKGDFPAQGWKVENGTLKTVAGGGGGDIITREQYGDFEFALEYKVAEGANSGIIYRCDERHGASWQTGPEFQILDDAGYGIEPLSLNAAGACYDLYPPSENKVSRPAGEWNQVIVRIKDGQLTHMLNGQTVVRADMNSDDWASRIAGSKFAPYEGFGVLEKGHIAIQEHGNEVSFRNIKVRDLAEPTDGSMALFDGESLDGLQVHTRGRPPAPVFTAKSGVLHCTGVPAGYIQTTDTYTNYVMTIDWRWPGEPGNSGVLLRKTGDDKVWPRSIEAQLYADNAGDLLSIDGVPMTGPAERSNGRVTTKSHHAERPVGEWNTYEIIVNGDAITLFVNGEKVNHVTGVPVEAGTICLQSEGVPIDFRNWRISSIR